MGSVIVANSNKDSARRIGAVLKTDGVLVYGLCTTGAQLLEMTSYHYRGGVVVCTLDLQDVTAWDLPQMAPNYDFLFIIKRAKQLLMERNYFTEAQAHRFLQKKSMDTGKRLIEIAAIVLEMF